jgi:hypothetical protein
MCGTQKKSFIGLLFLTLFSLSVATAAAEKLVTIGAIYLDT